MDSSASAAKRSKFTRYESPCKVKFSICFSTYVPGARLSYLGMLALVLTLSQYGYGVKGDSFSFNGFTGFSDVLIVQNSAWNYRADNGSFFLDYGSTDYLYGTVNGRFMYPNLVQMIDNNSNAVKSFSTTFIYQILVNSGEYSYSQGSGMAFIMVPDNITLGASSDYMGLLTEETPQTPKNYDSDNHTLGVELDTHMNPEFDDPNENHLGIDLASMNSTYNYTPVITLTTENTEVFQQVWIDYFQADSRMDIYITRYGQGKPAMQQGTKSGLNLSFLKEYMYIGFSAATNKGSSNTHTVLAWSFSNEGDAPPIKIARDVPPGSSPPPPAPSSGSPPPTAPSGPVAPAPNPSPNGPQVPPPSASPPPMESNPPPPGPAPGSPSPPSPRAPPPLFGPPPGRGAQVKVIVVVMSTVGALIVVGIAGFFCWWKSRHPAPQRTPTASFESGVRQNLELVSLAARTGPKFRIFISHTGGADGSKKNLPINLYEELKRDPRYEVFIDRYELPLGTPFPEEIMQELRKFDMGTGVGIMVLTKEFLEKTWPMLELVKFVDMQEKNGPSKVRILPLFYELRPENIRKLLAGRDLEKQWANMSTESHPINIEKIRNSVRKLCSLNGVIYNFSDWSYHAEYIKVILEKVSAVYEEMQTNSNLGVES